MHPYLHSKPVLRQRKRKAKKRLRTAKIFLSVHFRFEVRDLYHEMQAFSTQNIGVSRQKRNTNLGKGAEVLGGSKCKTKHKNHQKQSDRSRLHTPKCVVRAKRPREAKH